MLANHCTVRINDQLLTDSKKLAQKKGIALSKLIREALALVLKEYQKEYQKQ
jgi:predicted DNA binding CopG/RHH family protein